MSWVSYGLGKLTGGAIGDKQSPGFGMPSGPGMSAYNPGSSAIQAGPGSTGPFSTQPNTTFGQPMYGTGTYGSGGSGGMSTYEKWQLGLGILGAGLSAYGQHQNSQDNKAMSAAQIAESGRQFNTTSAAALAKQLESAPLRDRASYLLQARMGANPQQFAPETLTQPGHPGGVDAEMAKARGQYHAGLGGIAGTTDLYKKLLKDMGYDYGG